MNISEEQIKTITFKNYITITLMYVLRKMFLLSLYFCICIVIDADVFFLMLYDDLNKKV